MGLDSISWIDFSSHRGTYRTPLRGSIAFYGVDAQCSDFAESDIFFIFNNMYVYIYIYTSKKKGTTFLACVIYVMIEKNTHKKLRSLYQVVFIKCVFSFALVSDLQGMLSVWKENRYIFPKRLFQ